MKNRDNLHLRHKETISYIAEMSHFSCTFFEARRGTHDVLMVSMKSYAVGLGLHCNRSVKKYLYAELSVLKQASHAHKNPTREAFPPTSPANLGG